MGIAKKVAYNTAIQVLGRGTSILLSLILIKYLTSYLSVEGYGEYVTAMSYVGIFAIIADFGLSTIVVRELSKREDGIKNYLGNVLGLRAVVAMLTMAAACLIVLFFPYSSGLKMGILVLSVANYLLSLNQVFVGVFQANMRIDKAVLGDIVGRMVIFIITLGMIFSHASLVLILSAIFVGNLVNLFISLMLVRNYVKPSLKFDSKLWKKLFVEMLPMGTVVVLGMIYFRSDMVILSVMKGNEAMGIYGISYKFVDILIALPQFFMGAVFPYIARYYVENREKFAQMVQKSFDVMLMVVIPIGVIFVILAHPIINLVSNKEFDAAALPLQLLVAGVVFSYITQVANFTLIATKKQNRLIYLYIFLIVENIVLNVILIPHYSYLAAAFNTSLSELIAVVGSWYLVKKEFGIRPRLNNWQWIVLAAGGAILTTELFKSYFWLALLSGLLVYIFILVLTKVLNKEKLLELFLPKVSE